MRKIFLIACAVFISFTSLKAQDKNAFLVSVGPMSGGYGYPSGLKATATNSIPTTNLVAEYGLSERITVGIYGAYTNWYDEFDHPQSGYRDDWKQIDVGVRAAYHFGKKNFDFYVSPFLGYTHGSMIYDKTNIYRDELNYKIDAINAGGILGIRYWIIPMVGLHLETGLSRKFFLGGGASFRFGGKKAQ